MSEDAKIYKMEVHGDTKLGGEIKKTVFSGDKITLLVEVTGTPAAKDALAHLDKDIAIIGYRETEQTDIEDPAQIEFPTEDEAGDLDDDDGEEEADIPCSVCGENFTADNILWDDDKEANFCNECLAEAE